MSCNIHDGNVKYDPVSLLLIDHYIFCWICQFFKKNDDFAPVTFTTLINYEICDIQSPEFSLTQNIDIFYKIMMNICHPAVQNFPYILNHVF